MKVQDTVLAYGLGAQGLAFRLKISETEAKNLIDKYFLTFPRIKSSLDRSAEFAINNGYITTLPPFKRVRILFESPLEVKNWGSIARMGKNSRIQGEYHCPDKKPLNGEHPEVGNPVLNRIETFVNA